jgi:hypothetical protein
VLSEIIPNVIAMARDSVINKHTQIAAFAPDIFFVLLNYFNSFILLFEVKDSNS